MTTSEFVPFVWEQSEQIIFVSILYTGMSNRHLEIFAFFLDEKIFCPDFASKHGYTQEYYRSYSFLSASVQGLVSLHFLVKHW